MAEVLGDSFGDDERVADDEKLLRSIEKGTEATFTDGKWKPPGAAFLDRYKQPSVDRKRLIEDLLHARRSPGAGIAELTAACVRGIDKVSSSTEAIVVDVIPAPLPENVAHALVVSKRQASSDGEFKRLRAALARCSEIVHWPDGHSQA